jgi:drug/metabolite transporter (DMT)-like permease
MRDRKDLVWNVSALFLGWSSHCAGDRRILWERVFGTLSLLAVAAWTRVRSGRSGLTLGGRSQQAFSVDRAGVALATPVGLFETIGLLVYSLDTRLAETGIAAAISSSFGLIPLVAGITIFHERPTVNQLLGVFLVIAGLLLLAIKPS